MDDTTAPTMKMAEILAGLAQRLTALGRDPADAASMMRGWYRFVDNDSSETGARTCDEWMDAEVVRLLDAGLDAHYVAGEPWPTFRAGTGAGGS